MNNMQPESVESINNKLDYSYGRTVDINQANFRVIWSEDIMEKRLTKYTKDGLQLLSAEIIGVPKYKQWVHQKYILERLTVVPEFQRSELAEVKLSYEPVWVFEDKFGNPLAPVWNACKFIIENLLKNETESKYYTKYADKGESPEEREKKLQDIERDLFGNETEVGDALAHKQAIIVPRNYN